MGELSTLLSIRHFYNDNENYRRLSNALHKTIWTVWTERNALRTKRHVLVMERNDAFKV